MKVLEPGHVYEVENIDGEGTQTINFVARRHIEKLSMPERHEACRDCGHIHVKCHHA